MNRPAVPSPARRRASSSHRRSLAAAALALLLLAPAAALAAADPKASRFYEDALTRYERKDIAGAIVQLKNALQIDKNMLPVHVLLGRALLASGDVGAAEVAFNEALRLGVNRAEVVVPLARAVIGQGKPQQLVDNPRFAPSGLPQGVQARLLLLRASAQADLGDVRSALKTIDEARALDPASPETWLAEVPVRIRARQAQEALAAADRALQMVPNSPDALYARGSVLHASGDLKGAQAMYDRALAADPKMTEGLVSRAGLLIDAARFADARKDVEELRRSSTKDPRGAYLKALLDERDGNTAGARAALTDVTNLVDAVPIEFLRYRPQVLMLGGLAHYGLGQREKAKPYLEAVQRQQPTSPVSKLLAQIHLADKNVDRAIESLDQYLRGQPNDSQALLLLASAHFGQGRHQRAAQLMNDALKTRESPEMRAMLGLALVGGGKFADAVKELETAFGKDPNQLQAGMALATIYLQSAQATKAVAIAQKMAKQQPNHAGAQNLLGSALAGNGDDAAARAAFERALKIDPAFAAPRIGLARLDIRAKAFDAAQGRLGELLKADDKNVDALSEMGLLQERLGRLGDAQRFLEKAADHSGSNDVAPGVALVDFHLRNGRADAAREATPRLTSKAPDNLQVLITLARVALANNDFDGARTNLTRASRIASYDAPILLRIASLQLAAGALPGAAYTLDKALQERPEFLPAQALLAEVELKQGETGKAETRARQIVAKWPRAAVGHGLLGDIALVRNQVPQALEAYRRAQQLEPNSDNLLRLYRLQLASDPKAALQLAEGWLRQRPKDLAVRRALADGQARAGNFAAARVSYETMLKSDPDDAEAMNNLANVLLLQGDAAGALRTAEQALAKRPNVPYIIGTAGWAAFKAGQPDRALQLLRDARLRDPNNPDTRYFLGAVLASTGRSAEAREELRGALQGGRSFASAAEAEKLLATLR